MKRKIDTQDRNRLRNYRENRAKFVSQYLGIFSKEYSYDQIQNNFIQKFSQLLETSEQSKFERDLEDIKLFEKQFMSKNKNENLSKLIDDFGSFYFSLIEERIYAFLVPIYNYFVSKKEKANLFFKLEKIFLSLSEKDLNEFEKYKISTYHNNHSHSSKIIPQEGIFGHCILILIENYDSKISNEQRNTEKRIYQLISNLLTKSSTFLNFDFASLSEEFREKSPSHRIFSSILLNSKEIRIEEVIKRIGTYIDFKKDLLYPLEKDSSNWNYLYNNFRKKNHSWKDVDLALNSSEEFPMQQNSLGCGLISIAKTEAILKNGFYTEIVVDYNEDYQNIDYEKFLSCKDQFGNNILHCIAKIIVDKVDIFSETIKNQDWEVYNEIIDDSQIWNINLQDQSNNYMKTPNKILETANLTVGIEVISINN